MAVYTRINQSDLSLIEKNFNIGKIVSFSGIKKGIENTNYLIKTSKKKIILTIFEKRVQKKDVCVALVLRTKKTYVRKNGFKVSLGENSCALLTSRSNKTPIGTRIFGAVPVRELRKAKVMKCILLARSTI